MGCGASSAPKECNDEQKSELCKTSGRQMMLLCVPLAMAKADQIKVTPPKELASLRQSADSLRTQAETARTSTQPSSAEADNEQPEEKADKKGGVLGAIGAAVVKGADKANELLGKGVGGALDQAAKALDAAVDTVEKPMTEIGKEIVEAKKDDITKVFQDKIAQVSMDGVALTLVRGAAPHGEEQYKAVSGNALSAHLVEKHGDAIAEAMRSVVQDFIDKKGVVKAWDQVIEKYNFASKKLEERKLAAFPKIELDINEHILKQVVAQLGELLGKEEKELRANPQDKSPTPVTFAAVFSGNQLTQLVFKNKDK